MSITSDHKKQIVNTLKKELGSPSEVSKFSQSLKDLSLIDLSDDVQLEKAANDGSLITFVTFYGLGLLPKLIDLQYKQDK